jgi:hypothetical protein
MPHNAVAKGPILPCEEPIEFEYRGGMFYLSDPALGFSRAMRPSVFFATIAKAVECSRDHRPWDRPSAEIIDFAAHAAASGKPSK